MPEHPVDDAPPIDAERAAAPTADQGGAGGGNEPEAEENIYEVMKQHMRRKQEELEAKNAQQRARPPGYGRPGPQAPPPPAPRPIEKVADVSNLTAVWQAARAYLAQNARMLESVLGHCTKPHSLNTNPPEITLHIPSAQQNFTNDRAKAKLEEALRAVTDMPLKLTVEFVAAALQPPPEAAGYAAPLAAAQRIPPELMDAVKKQPLVQELMKRFDATVTQVEVLETPPSDQDSPS